MRKNIIQNTENKKKKLHVFFFLKNIKKFSKKKKKWLLFFYLHFMSELFDKCMSDIKDNIDDILLRFNNQLYRHEIIDNNNLELALDIESDKNIEWNC